MCGRYVIDENDDAEEMRKVFVALKKKHSETYEYQQIKTGGEIFPSDVAPVIIPAKGNKIDAVPMKWGFNNYTSNGIVINARSEGIYQRRMFRDAIIHGRCVIPTNGFYEWKKYTDGRKSEKYLIKKASGPMLYLAGIYDRFIDSKTGENRVQFVIITRESEGVIRSIHHRLPVHVEKRDILKWLNGQGTDIDEIFQSEIPEYLLKNVSV